MAIKESNYSKKETAWKIAQRRLVEASETKNLPQDLKSEIDALIVKFKVYDMSKHKEKGIKLTGKILSGEEVLELVKEATGYTKWSFFKEEDYSPKYIINEFNLDIKEEDVVLYQVERSTRSRDDIFMISVTCLPGCVYITMQNDRADASIEHLIKNADIKDEIEKNFD